MATTVQEQVVKERPIIFSGEMVRAILSGTKTQTRRVVKWPKRVPQDLKCASDCKGVLFDKATPGLMWGVTPGFHVPCLDGASQRYRNPWNWPNVMTRLWVREASAVLPRSLHPASVLSTQADRILYAATTAPDDYAPAHWASPVLMRREFSRITLEITEVKVERLNEITNEDATAEGICPEPQPCGMERDHAAMFAKGWDKLNAERGYAWDSNPWVWVVKFKVIQPTSTGREDASVAQENALVGIT